MKRKPNLDYPYLSLPDRDENEIYYKQKDITMTYLEKYPNCNGCPVEEYCGTVVGSIKLCHSYKEGGEDSSPVLTLSKNTSSVTEEDYIEEQLTMWDNKTD
jgi:hypothetical protein